MSDSPDFLDPATSSASSSRRLNTSIRPRNRRLIPINDEDEEDRLQTLSSRLSAASNGLTPPQSRGTTPSPYASRRGSPLPQKHPSRATEREISDRWGSSRDESRERGFSHAFGSSSQSSQGFFESSWSSIQSLASSVLGNESSSWGKPTPFSSASAKRRKPSRSDIIPTHLPKQTGPSTWGPSTPSTSQIGAGTREERQALVQAKKRETLLLANGDSVSDLKGRYKRKDSVDRTETTEEEQNEEALVYVHHVQSSDTMTGLSIKYGCPLAIFRKANGFWPSDSIQTRKTVLLPAEACSVKGRRIPKPENQDLLGDGPSAKSSTEDLNGSSIAPVEPQKQDESGKNVEGEQIWKHEAWVQMEDFPAPVEIGRVPRKTLGFFPRSRRRSMSIPYSDIESTSTPPSESSTTHKRAESPLRTRRDSSPRHFRPSPRLTPGTQSPALSSTRSNHRRTASITLSGPGGVGTLGRDVHAPGPAPDGLNKFFSQHLPHLAAPPPPSQLAQQAPTSRKGSFDSMSSIPSTASYSGLENVGGAIEGWMRKMATRAKTGLNEMQQGSSSHAPHGHSVGISGFGDLIELSDGLEGTTPPPSNRRDYLAHSSQQQQQSQTLGKAQYERFSSSSASTSRARGRVVDDSHKND